jgi:hypothetical protein
MNGKIIAGAAALLVLLGVALYLLSDDSQPRARAGDAGVAGAQDDDPARRPPNTVRDARGMQGNGADDPVLRARFAESVQIISTGTTPTTLTPDRLWDALAAHEVEFNTCVQVNGGADALRVANREQRRADMPDAGARSAMPPQRSGPSTGSDRPSFEATPTDPATTRRTVGRTASFDVKPDGSVDRDSITLDPPVPEQFSRCFVEHVAALSLGSTGADGARVEMPMHGPRRRLPRANPDGGVPPI